MRDPPSEHLPAVKLPSSASATEPTHVNDPTAPAACTCIVLPTRIVIFEPPSVATHGPWNFDDVGFAVVVVAAVVLVVPPPAAVVVGEPPALAAEPVAAVVVVDDAPPDVV